MEKEAVSEKKALYGRNRRSGASIGASNRLHYWGAFPDKAPYIQK